jgi:hypothetical protein
VIITLAVGLFAVSVPWRYLRPAYDDPVVTASDADSATSLDVRFAKDLRLIGYGVEPQEAKPGERIKFTLYWQAIGDIDAPLTVFVQLAPSDPEHHVASIDEYLGGSHYPSDIWQPGETIRQIHWLQLPDDVPAPGVYWFTVGLYTTSYKARLPVVADGAQVPGQAVRLGPLRVLDQSDQTPEEKTDYHLGSVIRLAGYDVDLSGAGESPLNAVIVTLYWEALESLDQDLAVFVHLLDAHGNLVAQHDGPPRQSDFPTWAWEEGDQISDVHTLLLPDDLEPGAHRLIVGMYGRQSGIRLPIYDDAGQRVPDDAVILTEFNLPGGVD